MIEPPIVVKNGETLSVDYSIIDGVASQIIIKEIGIFTLEPDENLPCTPLSYRDALDMFNAYCDERLKAIQNMKVRLFLSNMDSNQMLNSMISHGTMSGQIRYGVTRI